MVLAAGLALGLALVGWRRRPLPGGTEFALLMLALAIWTSLSGLEKTFLAIAARVWCSKFQYLGIASVAPLWLLFALRYTRRDQWLTRRNSLALWVVPLLTVLLAFTNDWHHLIWTTITPTSDVPGMPLNYAHGAWFWLAAAYSYLLLLSATLALLWSVIRYPQVHRRQALGLLLAAAVPWTGNIIYLTGSSPLPGLDPTPFGFALTGLILAWTVFRYRLLDLVPVAREAVVESLDDGVVVLDLNNRVADINPAALRMSRHSHRDEVVGRSLDEVFAAWPEEVARFRDVPEAQVELTYGSPAPRHWEMRIMPLRDQAGRTTGRVVLLRDITAQKMLETLRYDLTNTMVHDLRAPLTNLTTALEMLARHETTLSADDQQHMLDIMHSSAYRLLGLVNSILDVSRLESGELLLERQRLRPRELVRETLQVLGPLATEKHIALLNEVPAKLPPLYGDPGLLGRVLENLVGNALKFAPERSEIFVAAKPAPEAGEVIFSVADAGPGIPPELQERLFQKYATGSVPGRGRGLGLAFCRLAMEAHKGRIWAESAPGAGSTFSLALPIGGEIE